MPGPYPIIYVRGYAGTQADVEETVDDPTYGFNAGSTHIRLAQDGRADFFMFVSPFARLFRDYGYQDVIDGALQRVEVDREHPERTIWIYRYYDPTSQTFDRPAGQRLSIEQAAAGLQQFIANVKTSVTNALVAQKKDPLLAEKVYLIAHSMGGLVCRCLIQRIYPRGTASDHIDKLFTYGTPHGGIHFDIVGGRLLEKLRDMAGINDSDNFGRDRMFEFLTPDPLPAKVPDDFDPRVMPPDSFDVNRVFCVIGTNAEDYAVAAGLSRTAVGPQSDGLVQIESAYVRGAHRAYIHRSHSGRYGMVNSEEGYQNLQRFLFGNLRIKASLADFTLTALTEPSNAEITYFVETQVAVRGLPVLMDEQTLRHFCAAPINSELYAKRYGSGPPNDLPLFTNFLLERLQQNGTLRYMIRIAIFQQRYENGLLLFADHMERLPVWSDYLLLELREMQRPDGSITYSPFFSWASAQPNSDAAPDQVMERVVGGDGVAHWMAPLPEGRARATFGDQALVRFEASQWG